MPGQPAIDRNADAPVFRQIAEHLRTLINDGVWEPGTKLPSETMLMEQYGVAHGTIRAALHELRIQGLVVPEQGRGVFVAGLVQARGQDRTARAALAGLTEQQAEDILSMVWTYAANFADEPRTPGRTRRLRLAEQLSRYR